ncbi:pentatricopeptide repeat-containing protein At5g15280, mitochondrial [Macadamia integrifolia]|uniref:pentatricopeptide repeat-containing protein At5g15280, mitochondrial n=1 Tax=Macadamia integrifolia TaxID=60698 RepID=UPI001C50194A|nr:pentatricopeptide repeat-containing protein At5g15280, mitochondrial [Macadamia integrifolia]XP_042497217.1 pentatricopeptide repeat-containing protein At5g15280, mitochondrial [Macadamia integrifolia]XP_042497218.1 pentatricopeptide repeat-containing protein At5g15280, mitochondrial [Macadamia integrifolia]XP_042497219.1 pentatricopeptide repeat-containing protein At5g15280, mitochondrial [Macadamia integrifolia]XP_042497220.1 pentatricopeptide repeat-containing protein At5g15280, mitochond
MRKTHKVFFHQLFQIPSYLHLWLPRTKFLHLQVCSLISHQLSFSTEAGFFSLKAPSSNLNRSKPNQRLVFENKHKPSSTNCKLACVLEEPTSSLGDGLTKTQIDSTDLCSTGCSSIGSSVILRCSYLWEKKFVTSAETSLRGILLKLIDIFPESTRRFLRLSRLKPRDVLEILQDFESQCLEPAIEARKVELLWELFKLAANQSKEFIHLPQSHEIMASMLVQVGLLRETELLLRTMESLFCNSEIISAMLEAYAKAWDLENSILMYNEMRSRGLIPSSSSYRVLLNNLVQINKGDLAFRVYMDMVESGFGLCSVEETTFELLVRLLCKDGKIQEARNLVREVTALGVQPGRLVINEIAIGYCAKKDFEDLLSFLSEIKCVPDAPICNKIMYSLCRRFGAEEAYLFMEDLNYLGFSPDEITFGILIGWSCRVGKLKDAFFYLSDLSSRCLIPDIHTYNAIISGLFKKSMWNHARDILDEMLEKGITPNATTFRVLLAGYCKARLFNEAKAIIGEMVSHKLIELSPMEDTLSKAFMILGLNPLSAKVKRDNDVGLTKTEFFDALGNGLYLETDIDEFEKTMMKILEDSFIPDFNSLVLKECGHGNVRSALRVKDEMVWWGQELSSCAYMTLVNHLSASHSHVKVAIRLLDEMPKQASHLDQSTLNLLIQATSKKGFTCHGRRLLDRMLQRNLLIQNGTYTALIEGLCKEGNIRELHECWELALIHKWLPTFKDCKALIGYLCQLGQIRKALELLENTLATYTDSTADACNMFLEELSVNGYTSIGHVLMEEVVRQGWILDQAAYNHLIRGFCKEKSFIEAFGVLDARLKMNMVPCVDVCTLLIPQLIRFHRMKKVMALKEMIFNEETTACLSVYNAIVKGLCKMGKVGEATLQFEEMLAKGIQPDPETYNLMVQGYCGINNLRGALEFIASMTRMNFSLSISSYRNLVCCICMEGRVLYALRMKELMLRVASCPILVVYNILIHCLFHSGNSTVVTTILHEMHEKGLLLDEVSYNFLVHGYLKCKDVSRSEKALKSMIDKDLRPNNRSFGSIIRYLCNEGELDKAMEMSTVMELRSWVHSSVVQNAIAVGLLTRGRLQEAEDFLDRMKHKGLIPNSICYDLLIKGFCYHGRLNRAVDLMNIMLMKGNIPSPSSYDFVIQSLCACNAFDQALDFHAEMLDRKHEPSVNTWDALVSGLCKDGRTVQAKMLLDSMLQFGQSPTQTMYQSVIKCCLENHPTKASELLHKMQQNGYVPDFEIHWSLISNLRNSIDNDGSEKGGFLSKLLSRSGFTGKKDPKAIRG